MAGQDWEVSVAELEALVSHPEPLARALAYSRLDPKVPEEARILRDRARKEPSEKIRAELLKKLSEIVKRPSQDEGGAPGDRSGGTEGEEIEFEQ